MHRIIDCPDYVSTPIRSITHIDPENIFFAYSKSNVLPSIFKVLHACGDKRYSWQPIAPAQLFCSSDDDAITFTDIHTAIGEYLRIGFNVFEFENLEEFHQFLTQIGFYRGA